MDRKQVLTVFLQALVKDAADEGFLMRKITLIKYLYLLDVYMAQETGQKFTDIDWIFWKFGPYSNDSASLIDEIIENGLIVEQRYDTRYDKDFVQYKPIDNSPSRKDVWKLFPQKVLNKIFNSDLKRFWDDTYKLLDYVYFDTEPMYNVKPGEKLNFENLEKDIIPEPIQLRAISKTKAKKILEILSKKVEKLPSTNLFPTFNDNRLVEFDVAFFEPNPINNFTGIASLK